MRRKKLVQFTLIALIGLPLTAQDLGHKEAALGRQLDAEMGRRTVAINSNVDDYLKRLTARVAAQIPTAREPFTLVVNADDPCSKTSRREALPGGYVYVRSALFAEPKNEADFAGMLAPVMEHITLQSLSLQQTHNRTTGAATIAFFLVKDCSVPGTVGSGPQILPHH